MTSSLLDLELAPSAVLIVIPVRKLEKLSTSFIKNKMTHNIIIFVDTL